MITYEKLIIVKGDRYEVRTDTLDDMSSVFANIKDVNTRMVLILKNGEEVYPVNLDKLFRHYADLLNSANVTELIHQLTPEMIYAYREELFVNAKNPRSFMSHDIPGDLKVSPCNFTTGELTDVTYDSGYDDMVILCDEYDLTNTIPVIADKLRMCSWGDGRTFIKDRVNLVKDIKELTFLSFANMTIELRSLVDIAIDGWVIPQDTTPMLVLNGALFYDSPEKYSIRQGKLVLNQRSVMDGFDAEFETLDDLISDMDSFVILVKSKRILIRELSVMPSYQSAQERHYYENRPFDHLVDYVCLDRTTNLIRGVSMFYPKFKNVITGRKDAENHIYADSGSSDMRLIQLSVFS